MKKLLLSSFLSLFVFGAFAQDIEVALVSPSAGQAMADGVPFDYTITIKNNGSSAIGIGDTILNVPLIENGLIGNPPILWIEDSLMIASGASVTVTHEMTLFGPFGQFNWCGWAFLYNVTETDTNNNMGCVNFYFNTDVSHEEFGLLKVEDLSYFSDDNYVLDVTGVSRIHDEATISIYDLSGALVIETEVELNSTSVKKNIAVGNLPSGIYLVQMNSSKGEISTRKVIKQ